MQWQRTKTNRLKAPSFPKLADEVIWAIDPCSETYHKTPLSKVGDYVYMRESGISAGTVGKVLKIDPCNRYGNLCNVEMLDGKTRLENHPHAIVIPYEMVQEVKDFYIIQEKRPERIKVDW